jgi:hypothetical protein
MKTKRPTRKFHGVAVGSLTLHFDTYVAARRFRKVVQEARAENWEMTEAVVLRLREVSNTSPGLTAWEVLERFAGPRVVE